MNDKTIYKKIALIAVSVFMLFFNVWLHHPEGLNMDEWLTGKWFNFPVTILMLLFMCVSISGPILLSIHASEVES